MRPNDEGPSLANYTPPVVDEAGNVVSGSPERMLNRYHAVTTGGMDGFDLFALSDKDAKTLAAEMVLRYQNNGRGTYKNLKLTSVERAPLEG